MDYGSGALRNDSHGILWNPATTSLSNSKRQDGVQSQRAEAYRNDKPSSKYESLFSCCHNVQNPREFGDIERVADLAVELVYLII